MLLVNILTTEKFGERTLMRIIAGKLRGMKLLRSKTKVVRATSSRLRETVFNVLVNGFSKNLIQTATVLDLFAGTGAMGIEAISRGADFCLFVDNSTDGCRLIRENVKRARLTDQTIICMRNATTLSKIPLIKSFDIVFMDPPYRSGLCEKAAINLINSGLMNDEAIVVLEDSSNVTPTLPTCFQLLDTRKEGSGTTHIYMYCDPKTVRLTIRQKRLQHAKNNGQ